MSVLHVSTVHPRGDVRILLKECGSLSRTGIEIGLLIQDGRGDAVSNGVSISDLGPVPSNRLKRMLSGAIRVIRSPATASARIVHFHDPELLPVGLVLKAMGKTVIYDAHEDVPRQIASKHWIQPRLRRLVAAAFERFENFCARRFDGVVAATPLIGERFARLNSRTVVVRNFPLLGEFLGIPLEREQTRRVCYIGAVTRERGILVLLDSLERLGNVRMTLCGPFESPVFEAELRRHPGWKHVDYRGVVGRAEVAEVLRHSRIGLVTLFPTPNQIEALPVKMFEYMAAGTPFIASGFPLWAKIARDSGAGVCVDPASASEIAEAIDSLLGAPERLAEMGQAGRKAAIDVYNWENEGATLVDFYRALLEGRSK